MNWPKHKWPLTPLLPFSWLYQGLVACRNFAYEKKLFTVTRVPAKVVSIGNLSVGGSGKTPTTAFLANALMASGVKVALVARGYHREGRGTCVVSDGRSVLAEIHEAGDEPLLLAQQCPGAAVVVDESKTHAAQIAAARFHPEVILVDDGFQHRRLHRDLNLIVISARMVLQKPWLLPAGPLREPLANAQRADVVLLTDSHDLNNNDRKRIAALCRLKSTARVFPIEFLVDEIRPVFEGKNLATLERHHASALLVSGIAFPERFRRSAEAVDVRVCGHLVYGDHHRYSEKDLEHLLRTFQRLHADIMLTTAKDAIKLRGFAQLEALPIYALGIRFSAEESLVSGLLQAAMPARDLTSVR